MHYRGICSDKDYNLIQLIDFIRDPLAMCRRIFFYSFTSTSRIFAYEHQNLDNRRVWHELPDDVFPFYIFINVGVNEETGKYNP